MYMVLVMMHIMTRHNFMLTMHICFVTHNSFIFQEVVTLSLKLLFQISCHHFW